MRICVGLMAAALLPGQDLPLPEILSRVSEEAEMFRRVAPQTLAEETLVQKSLKKDPRFRPRLEVAAKAATTTPEYARHEVISEYSFASMKESPGGMHEFRQVTSVDGRRVTTPENARHALSLGLRAQDDRLRKRMLEDFQKNGLQGAAGDFGQLILLFTKRELPNYEFRLDGPGRVGDEDAVMVVFEQRQGGKNLLVFEGRKTVRVKMGGRIWARRKDGLPLRINMHSVWTELERTRRHEAVVEYMPTSFGILAPATVKHSEYLDNLLVTENFYRYSQFRKFGADAEIKFQTLPEPEPKPEQKPEPK